MLKATAGKVLPTTITGSLPRPSWYTENLGLKSFLDAMVISRFREQYVDALSVYIREQEVAGLDIVTDGDCRFDQDVGGQSWTSYPPHHMEGFEATHPKLASVGAGGIAFPRGHILHDYLEARVMPQIHLLAARGYVDKVINPEFMLKVFNNTVRGLRAKTEVWCHTCWGNPSQQRMFAKVQSYKPALELLNQVDADVITFEMKSSGAMDLEDVGHAITEKKVAIGAIDHHTLQVESPEEVASLVRKALAVIPAERLVLSSDCGMGREGMSRRHAFYKMVSLVQGVNLVKKEIGLPVTESL